jgi:two-component system, NtrC family, sensor kinase
MKIIHTIAFRLFLLIVPLQTIVLVLLAYGALRLQESILMEQTNVGALRVSDMILRATQRSMMLNRKEDVDGIVMSVGGEPGIYGLRIYNKVGEVVFSSTMADVGKKVDLRAEACVSCHPSGNLTKPLAATENLSRRIKGSAGENVLALITPIKNAPECSNADCHAHPSEKTILGVLDVKLSMAQIDQRIAESKQQYIYLSVGAVLLVALISGGFIRSEVRTPVKRLITGMRDVSSGNLDSRLPALSRGELGILAQAFNEMTEELSRARKELTAWSGTLELKVKEKTADLERAHKDMVKVEKMASLGNLASSVAHELNNPLEGILTFARLLMKRVAKSSMPAEEIAPYTDDLKLVADEAMRCGNIVKNLLVFARQRGVAFQPADLAPVIERCALLMNHHAKMHNVTLNASCDVADPVECDPNQIQQVLIALMVNAIEAMGATTDRQEGGTLTLSVRKGRGDRVEILVADTGIGMSDDTKAHIFEPFFTTKVDGKGVGLGLAVAYGIIQRHNGALDVESTQGRGTTFIVSLPFRQPPKGEKGQVAAPPVEGTQA